ncbi:protein kinase [Nonomuraea sp. NPDC001831]|uniref:serine/threonine-protein kinase n=1 Tax=Nonomuraea sp. NPDC001831 TaxID=3364340 RepID=UPI00369AEF9B
MLPAEDAPGYRVLDQAGQGGFAVVYRAYQERLDRVVALKVLSVDRVDQRTMRRFQRELRLTGRLTGHPHVVTVFDTGVTRSGKPYIAMDFFENGSLRDRVRKEGPLGVPDVLRAGVKLAGALAAVHEAGVLHGDIKPQNILVSRYGEPAIADFGVARVVDNAEISATSQAFTPLHAAPEVLTGQPHSVSGDIYSLGSTLYHLLAGQPAFHNPADPSIAPLMYRVLSLDPPPINRPDVPPAVFGTILHAMSKQPGLRPGSARELAWRLQEVQAELGLPVTDLVGQDPGPGPATSTVPRRPRGGPQAPPHPGDSSLPATGSRLPHAPASPSFGGNGGGAGREVPTTGDMGGGRREAPTTGNVGGARRGAPTTGDVGGARREAVTAPPAGAGSLGRRLLIGGSVAAVAIGGTGLAVYLSLRPPAGPGPADRRPEAATSAATPAATAATTPPPISKRDVAALAPRRLKVTADRGALVELSWALPADARRYPVVLQRSRAGGGDVTVVALGTGATSGRVAGLDPDTGYCFLVGVPLRISAATTVAWSKPACVRGARSAQ